MNDLSRFKSLLEGSRNSVIVTHVKPDADALGSSLGMAGYLRKKGHAVHIIVPSRYPYFLSWMQGSKDVIVMNHKDAELYKRAKKLVDEAEIIFCLDFSDLKRILVLGEWVAASPAKKVMIDHHLDPAHFAYFEYWNPKAASTAGLIFDLIDKVDEKAIIDTHMANCLYAGLMTDTGGFKHPNTTQQDFITAAELVGLGANPSYVSKMIYDSNTLSRMKWVGFILSKKLNVLPEYNTAYIMLDLNELAEYKVQVGDTEGLVNYGLSIEGIRFAVLMYERDEEVRLSFRSLGDFPVNEIAKKYFSGGGHKNAAGGVSTLTLEETFQKLFSILPGYTDLLHAHRCSG